MQPFDIAQAFVEQCERGLKIEDLKAAFEQALQSLGFKLYACCSHVDPLNPPPGAVVLHSYPKEWVKYFSEVGHYSIDPVFRYANRTLLPFSWDSAAFRASLTRIQREILLEAQAMGIEHGYTVPIHRPGALPASCSVVPQSTTLDRPSYLAVCLMGAYFYEAVSAEAGDPGRNRLIRPRLTEREQQCLELAAQGKSDWAVGRILGISERTVHNHIERAKARLGVTTRVQAIVHALFDRQIAFGDVIQSELQSNKRIP